MRLSTFVGGTALAALLLFPALGSATESALMKAPARNAALIAKVPGFKSDYPQKLHPGRKNRYPSGRALLQLAHRQHRHHDRH